jgi:Flp pilus assembly pilin Flp
MKNPTYKVFTTVIDTLSHYCVINTLTNAVHSEWTSLSKAITAARDLNRMCR